MYLLRVLTFLICTQFTILHISCVADGWLDWGKESGKECLKHMAFQAIGLIALPFIIEKSSDLYYAAQGKDNPLAQQKKQHQDYLKYKTEDLRLDVVLKEQEETDGHEVIVRRRIETLYLLMQNAATETERELYKQEYDAYAHEVLVRYKQLRLKS